MSDSVYNILHNRFYGEYMMKFLMVLIISLGMAIPVSAQVTRSLHSPSVSYKFGGEVEETESGVQFGARRVRRPRVENQNLNNLLNEANEEIANLKRAVDYIEEQRELLVKDKVELKEEIDSSDTTKTAITGLSVFGVSLSGLLAYIARLYWVNRGRQKLADIVGEDSEVLDDIEEKFEEVTAITETDIVE
jgi:hypothetical protein